MSLPDSVNTFDAAVRDVIADALVALGGERTLLDSLQFSTVPDPELGDVAVACFMLRGKLGDLGGDGRDAQNIIADALAEAVDISGVIAAATAAGPYVNFKYRFS